MIGKYFLSILVIVALISSGWESVRAEPPQFPQNATFTTLTPTPRAIEGLTGDGSSNLYTGGSGNAPCPILQINFHNPIFTVVGNVPAAATPARTCGVLGITFQSARKLSHAACG